MTMDSLNALFKSKHTMGNIKKDVIIYGTGTIAREVYKVLINKGYNIKYFMNTSFKFPNEVENLAVTKRVDDIEIVSEVKEDATIIIAIFNPYADIHKIITYLKDLGFNNIISFAELIDIFEDEFIERFYLNKRKDIIKDKEKILEVASIWNDEKSNKLYESIVKFRLNKNYEYLEIKDPLEEQYFPSDIQELYNQDCIRFVDCGAFDGDTIINFCNKDKQLDSVIAFEPDINNYRKLINVVQGIKQKGKVKDFSAFPCAVYSDSIQLKFHMEGSTGSNISHYGLNTVQCVSIDQCIGDYKPTYLKMDIEGSEYEALLGAKKTICTYKPNLAISLYHKPDDFYKIPLLINSWNLGYKFYLRMYYFSAFELVLYAAV